ncbi:hypothetical protein DFH06DRAFT_732564 [Mycena polygramma]|nr:hypothetical protein DFH06DRAFT_732564 [Mycena polygramma]
MKVKNMICNLGLLAVVAFPLLEQGICLTSSGYSRGANLRPELWSRPGSYWNTISVDLVQRLTRSNWTVALVSGVREAPVNQGLGRLSPRIEKEKED